MVILKEVLKWFGKTENLSILEKLIYAVVEGVVVGVSLWLLSYVGKGLKRFAVWIVGILNVRALPKLKEWRKQLRVKITYWEIIIKYLKKGQEIEKIINYYESKTPLQKTMLQLNWKVQLKKANFIERMVYKINKQSIEDLVISDNEANKKGIEAAKQIQSYDIKNLMPQIEMIDISKLL